MKHTKRHVGNGAGTANAGDYGTESAEARLRQQRVAFEVIYHRVTADNQTYGELF